MPRIPAPDTPLLSSIMATTPKSLLKKRFTLAQDLALLTNEPKS